MVEVRARAEQRQASERQRHLLPNSSESQPNNTQPAVRLTMAKLLACNDRRGATLYTVCK